MYSQVRSSTPLRPSPQLSLAPIFTVSTSASYLEDDMLSSQRPKQEENPAEQIEYVYRGRKIEVRKDDERQRLFIDDQEVEMEQTENGVLSHEFMFQLFGTPFELAEELIKQWGGAKIERAQKPSDHPHHH